MRQWFLNMSIPRLLTKYRKEVVPKLRAEFGYKSVMAVPRLRKVVVNVGYGKRALAKDSKGIERMQTDLAKLTGQKSAPRLAKQSIAGFKLRQGLEIGALVTLRGRRMYDFIDRLISVALPRSRDFRGLDPKAFDQAGNLNIGIKENNIFPEISYESLKDIFSLEVTVVTTAGQPAAGIALLRYLGFPLKV